MEKKRDAILLAGSDEHDADLSTVAATLTKTYSLPVEAWYGGDTDLIDQAARLAAADARRIVAVPLMLEPLAQTLDALTESLRSAQVRTPDVTFAISRPLLTVDHTLAILGNRLYEMLGRELAAAMADPHTALIVVGPGSADAERNASLAWTARLLGERRGAAWVETAYIDHVQPDLWTTVVRCAVLGAQRVIIVPCFLANAAAEARLVAQIERAQAAHPWIDITQAGALASQQVVGILAMQRYREAIDVGHGGAGSGGHAHRLPDGRVVNHAHTALAILPPRYQGNRVVSAAPMSAAPVRYDINGQVAWDQMWGLDDPDSPFCELALAGGPPHRGDLLEPVTPEAVAADPIGYGRVLGELERGIRLTTGLTVAPSRSPGWIGVICDSDEMAIWLLRAIVVENVSVRREASTLYLPAGPAFSLDREIRNVITVLAKTHHYWQEHLRALPVKELV